MGYIKKIKTDKDKKKVVSVRVPEIVVNAFNNAGVEAKEFGYEFKMPDVIEEALINTLNELRNETGVDFLKLEKFKHEMNSLQDKLKIDSKKQFDFNKLSNEIKTQAFSIGNMGESVDIDLMIKEKEQEIKNSWNEYMINRKEKKVRSELDQLRENNQHLQAELSNVRYENYEEYQNSVSFDQEVAHHEGWGNFYDEALKLANKAYQDIFDETMSKNKQAIQSRLNDIEKKELAAQKSYLVKKHPEKSDAEIERIMKKSPFYGLNAKLRGLDKELH